MRVLLFLLISFLFQFSVGTVASPQNNDLFKKPEASSVVLKPLQKAELPLKTKSKIDPWKPYLTVFAGILAHLTFGTLYCWGNFVSYTPNNLKYFLKRQTNGGSPDALILLPLNIVAQAATSPIGPRIQKRLGSRKTIMFGSIVMSLGIFISSFTQKLAIFALFYGCMYGFGIGIGYSAPLIAGWQWFPKAKGLVTGLILTGFGSGAFFFNKIGSRIVNPENLNQVNGVFPDEVYARFPKMLRVLSLSYLIIGLAASCLVSQPKENRIAEIRAMQLNEDVQKNKKELENAIKSRQFITLWAVIMLSAQSGINTIGTYKTFGSLFEPLQSDNFQSFLGGVASLFNGAGRVIWGAVVDRIGFRRAFMVCTLLQVCCMALFPLMAASRTAYAIAVCTMFLCVGGNFTIAPTASVSIWGTAVGPTAFGYLFSSFSAASLLAYFLTKQMVLSVGWTNVFRSLSLSSAIAFILLATLDPRSSAKQQHKM